MLDRKNIKSKIIARNLLKRNASNLYPIIRKKKVRNLQSNKKIMDKEQRKDQEMAEKISEENQDLEQHVNYQDIRSIGLEPTSLPLPKSPQDIEAELYKETMYPNLDIHDWVLENNDDNLYVDMTAKDAPPSMIAEHSVLPRPFVPQDKILTSDIAPPEVESNELNINEFSPKISVIREWLLNFEKYLSTFDEISIIRNLEDHKEALEYSCEIKEKLGDLNKKLEKEVNNEKHIKRLIERDVYFINGKAMEIIENFRQEITKYKKTLGAITKMNKIEELQAQVNNISLTKNDVSYSNILPTEAMPKTVENKNVTEINPCKLQYGVELEAIRNIDGNEAGSQLPIRRGDRLTFTTIDTSTNLLKVTKHTGKDLCQGLISPRDVKLYAPLQEKKPPAQQGSRAYNFTGALSTSGNLLDSTQSNRHEAKQISFSTQYNPSNSNSTGETSDQFHHKSNSKGDKVFHTSRSSNIVDKRLTAPLPSITPQEKLNLNKEAGRRDVL